MRVVGYVDQGLWACGDLVYTRSMKGGSQNSVLANFKSSVTRSDSLRQKSSFCASLSNFKTWEINLYS